MTNSNKNSHKQQNVFKSLNFKRPRKNGQRHIRPEILIGLVIVLCILITAIALPNFVTNTRLKGLGYTNTEIKVIKKEKLTKQIIDNKYYSSSLAKALDNGSVNPDYLELYTVVKDNRELSADDFLLFNRLQDKGYDHSQILNLYKNLEFWEITPLLVFDYQWDETIYIDDCKLHRDTNSNQSFTLSNQFITPNQDTIVDNPSDMTVFINQNHSLPSDYVPSDLTTVDLQYASSGVQLKKESQENFEALSSKSIDQGVALFASTGYESYQNLTSIYNSYSSELASMYADIPGQSEQQTGYSVDVSPTYEGGPFSQTEVYQWLQANAAEYGFILRYPIAKATITGNQTESNQLRYLGKALSKAIVDSNLTYDEYYLLYLSGWSDENNIPKDSVLSATNYLKYLNEKSE
ncbi:MAG: M15 family metallopeptidase [Erysipelotrichaceae bacterium]|nr:M15 family metallopeptidase [Erysipelotrichaceae bacterium]